MLTLGHLSASYSISKIKSGSGVDKRSTVFILICGYIWDLDILLTAFFGLTASQHHLLPTHTPFFIVTLWIILYLPLRRYFTRFTIFLGFCSAILHLLLDDLGYWLQLLGLQAESKIPQIFWLYPFDNRRDFYLQQAYSGNLDSNALQLYLTKAPVNIILEIALFVLAVFLYLRSKHSRKDNVE